jgi:hypothetical protein
MEFLTPETTDRFGVASFVEGREEIIELLRVRLGVGSNRLYQLFNQGA